MEGIFKGCAKQLTEFVEYHLIYLLASVMGIFFMGKFLNATFSLISFKFPAKNKIDDDFLISEILGMLCSLCLCCAVKRIEDMKA